MSEAGARASGGGVVVGLSLVIALALAGFLVGVNQRPLPLEREEATPAHPGEVATAPTYDQLAAGWRRADASGPIDLAMELTEAAAPPPPETKDREATRQAVARRARNRAYAGAPPTIPHPVLERGTTSCLACHEHGLDLGTARAPRMSHQRYTMCTQCHAPPSPLDLEMTLSTKTLWQGVREPVEGARAWQGAPPVIPHSTRMREDCKACHGPAGPRGLQTTHPDRQNCQQCHMASSTLEQHP